MKNQDNEYQFQGTQGEWKRVDTESYAEIRNSNKDIPIALVANRDDANLITAAPELLTACITALKQIQDLDSALNHKNHSVAGWHLNGELEPVENFFNENDCGAVEKLTNAICKALNTPTTNGDHSDVFAPQIIN